MPYSSSQRTVTMKAFRNTFLIVMPWLVFNCVMASLLVASYNCVYEVDREDIDEGGGEEGNKDLNPDGLPLCKDMPLEFPKGGELVFALSGPLPAFIFHLLCILGKIKSRIELRSRSAKLSTFFACIYSAVVLGVNMLAFLYNNVDEIFIHLMQVGSISLLVMNMIFPFAIYKSLIADTKYWRGLGKYNRGIGQNSCVGDSGAGGEVGPVSISVASTNMQNMMNSHILVDFSHLKVGKRIGRGSTATVYKGEFKKQEVAIKVFIPPEITEDDVNSFSQEAGMAAGLIHKNIVKTIGICVRPPSIALVCEFCEHGSLGEFIRSPEIVEHANLLWRFRCAIDAVAAVQYLHSCNILHRDIKADNYFLDSKGTVKLGDFGESTLYERNAKRRRSVSSGSSGKKMTIVGTISNMAPEMINAQRRYTEAVDIYSLGVTLWEIWTSETPFKKFNQFQIYQMVGEDRVRPNFPDDMNEVYKQCVNAAWGQTATERPRAKTLLKALCMEHDRINGVLNKVVKKMKPKVRSGRDSSEIGKSTEEERSDSFEMAEEDELPKPLPLAFKMKSESDNSTLTSSITSPPTEMVAGRSNTLTARFKLQNIGNSTKVGKSVKMYRKDGTGSIDSIASDLTEDDDLDVAIMIKAKSENLTVSLREYEETNLRKRGATSVDNPVQSSDLRKR
jgi:serine/threonine protein kinase